jgi:hypothetical protein
MSGLEIHPHSRRITHFAVVGLSLVAAGSFALSLTHHAGPEAASPFPAVEQSAAVAAGGIPEATPAPDIQVAAAAPRKLPVVHVEPVDSPDPAVAESPSPTDAAATTSDPPPRTPAPPADPSPAPNTAPSPADPPT